MYAIPTSQCVEYSEKEINEYNLELCTPQPRIDPYGKLKKMVAKDNAYLHSVEEFWEN